MDFMKEYESWLSSGALLEADKKELESIREDRKEIEERLADAMKRYPSAPRLDFKIVRSSGGGKQ